MSWTDNQIIKVIRFLRDKYSIDTFVETGTFKGVNAKLHSKNFKNVLTCEKSNAFYETSKNNLEHYKNVEVFHEESPDFLKSISNSKKYIFYLDAHFYDPNSLLKDNFVVLKELDNMKKFKNSIIIIHDFHNGLGGITYDGIDLNMDLVRSRLKKINKNFFFYTNTLEGCDPVKPIAKDMLTAGLEVDYDTLDNINYAWSSPEKTYRGVLYCLPTKLYPEEIKGLGLREWK